MADINGSLNVSSLFSHEASAQGMGSGNQTISSTQFTSTFASHGQRKHRCHNDDASPRCNEPPLTHFDVPKTEMESINLKHRVSSARRRTSGGASGRGPATVDGNGAAMDKAGIVAGQEDDSCRHPPCPCLSADMKEARRSRGARAGTESHRGRSPCVP